MIQKHVIRPDKIRKIPRSFSWIDRRLIRENHIEKIDVNALALYLLLSLVGDQCGLSYYSEKSLMRLLKLCQTDFAKARRDLINNDLIAYEPPLYQVLDLGKKTPRHIPSRKKTNLGCEQQRTCTTNHISSIINQITKGNDHD